LKLVESLCTWLAATPASHTIKSVAWIIPAVQTVHILAVAAVITAALVTNLRLLGIGARELAMAAVTSRFLPYLWWSLPVLFATGLTLIVGEPARVLKSPVFLMKMGLLLAAAGATLGCQMPLRGDAEFWHLNGRRRRAVRLLAAASLSLWIAIIFAGRWIAYVQGA
jgi:hypothetical protein